MVYSDQLKQMELIDHEFEDIESLNAAAQHHLTDTLRVSTAVCPNGELVCDYCLAIIPVGVGHWSIDHEGTACDGCHDSLITGRPLLSKAAVGCHYTYGPVV